MLFAVLLTLGAHLLCADGGLTFGTAGKEKLVLKAGVEADLFRYNGKGFLARCGLAGISKITDSRESAFMWMANEKHPSIWN